jgi:hypothetical protein
LKTIFLYNSKKTYICNLSGAEIFRIGYLKKNMHFQSVLILSGFELEEFPG